MSKRLITPICILSYPHLFEPQAAEDGGEEKYSGAFIFTEETDISEMEDAALAVLEEEFGDKAAQMVKSGKVALPWRDGNDKDGYPENSTYFSARSKKKPGVVSIYPDKRDPTKPALIDDEDEIYPGCLVRASVGFFYYDKKGKKGVGVGLNNVQKIKDGPRLDTVVNAADEFSPDEDAVADISSMTSESDEDTPPKTRSHAASTSSRKTRPAVDDEDDGEDLSALVGKGKGRATSRR